MFSEDSCLRINACLHFRKRYSWKVFPLMLLLIAIFFFPNQSQASDWNFRVRFAKEIHPKPFSGRVYLFFSKKKQQPRFGPDWFHPEIILSKDVKSLKPEQNVLFSSSDPEQCRSFPSPINELNFSGYRVQAVIRLNPYTRKWGTGAGNGFSQPIQLTDANTESILTENILTVDQIVKSSHFQDSQWSKQFRHRSKLLSDFHGRDVYLQGAVIFPNEYYRNTQKKYPVIYFIPGFGGTHFMGQSQTPPQDQEIKFIRVILDPSCQYGHHVFADSATNGPVGKAFTKEFIPALEKKHRVIADSRARFLTGHSSGGWSSLWLQITYPEFFGGTWSTSPDPVDFRDFQKINIYSPGENMFKDQNGEKRPLARRGNTPVIWYQSFSDMENVLGYGGQLISFEAVFSPKGKDGTPERLWNRSTGQINLRVAEAWKKYDIQRILTSNPELLKTKLKGKIHIYMGDLDTFYLEGATILLKESLKKMKSDAEVQIFPGKDHFTLLSSQLRQQILKEMNQQFTNQYLHSDKK